MLTSDLPIAERASPVLYHYTTPRAALEILKSGEFQLSSVVGNPSEQQLAPKGHPYFLSTTRSRVGDYHRYTHNSAVMFTLDGDWFNRNYKVRPVDYWERAWDYPESSRTRESEDRVFSREATIPAAGIRAVHVLVKGQDDRSGSHVRKVLITAKQQGIPAHLYQDERAWRVQDTSKAIPMDQARDLLRGREASPWGGRGRRYLEPWVELIHKNKTADLSADAAKLVHNIVYYHRGDPTEDMNLGVDLANARKPGETDRPLAVKLISYLKKFDFDTRRMVKDLHDKWAEIKTQEYEAKRAATKEDISESTLVEVSMSPGDLRRWAASPEAEGIQAGFEAELIFRDAERDGGDDSEPDWDADRRAESIDDVLDFFSYDEYGYGLSGRGYNRVREGLYEEYLDWREEAIMDEWSNVAQEQVEDYMESNVWGDDSLRDEYRDQAQIELGWKDVEVEDLTDEQKAEIEDLSRKMFEEDVQEEIGTEGNYYDDAREYFRDMMVDSDDYDEEAFLSDKYRYMSDIRDAWDLDWPYYSGGGSGEGRTVEDIANSLSDALDGASVIGSSGYHSTTRKPGRWIIEPDGSLDPDDSDEAGLEVVSPPMPLPQALEALQKVVDWANGDGDAYTNSSTGLHMGVSVPYKGGDVDYVKLILFLGDQYVLEQFGRMSNSYCRSALAKLQDVQRWRQERLDGDSKSGVEKTAAAMDLMRKNLVELAAKYVQDGVGKDKYTSAHIKDGYIEFRSPGGDYLSQVNREDFVVLESTMLRFARAMHIASRPDLERKEYIKKLYKLIDPTGDESLKLFLDYSTGKINQEDLKKAWARGVLAKEQPRQTGGEKYEIYNQDTGEVLDVISGENQEQLTLAVTDAIEKYSGTGINYSIRKQEEPAAEPSRRAKVAQKIASRPMIWRVTDTNTGKTLLVAADTASLAKVAAEQQDRHWFELRRNDPDSFVAQSATGSEIRQYMANRPAGGQSTQQQSTGAEQRYRVRWTERRNGEEVQDSLVVAARNADAAMDSIRSALDAQGRQPVSIEADLAGSTQDLQRQRAQQATGGEQFTGRWEIRNASNGDILHTFGGIGNNQSDANRFAAGWLGRNRPDLANQEIEVVPEMR